VIGTILEKYAVLEKLGEGAMAIVYLGRHSTLGRTVAIKVLRSDLAALARHRTRFEREAKAIESLRHPNILSIYDFSGADSEHCFIVTEYIEGPTLARLLDEVGVMMAEPAALISRQLCDALGAAHALDIIHRDLKPANVMFDGEGAVKLMDFGLARILDGNRLTKTGAVVGSPEFMSPEQITGDDVGPTSDVFALGILMYRMVTGALPFRGNNTVEQLQATMAGRFEEPSDRVPSLASSMADIIRRCLSPGCDQRYGSTAELKGDLEALLAGVDIDPQDPGPWAISRYLADYESYETDLAEHLLDALLRCGKKQLAEDDHAAALKTFVRILALDEDNREVIGLMEGMGSESLDEEPGGRL